MSGDLDQSVPISKDLGQSLSSLIATLLHETAGEAEQALSATAAHGIKAGAWTPTNRHDNNDLDILPQVTGGNFQVSNRFLTLLIDFVMPPFTTGDPPPADVTDGSTITPSPRTTYNLTDHTNLTFTGSATDNYDTSGFDQALTLDGGGEINVYDQGYLLNLTLKNVALTDLYGFNRDPFGHVTLYGSGYSSNQAASPYLVADGFGGSKLTNPVGQTIVDFAQDPLALVRTQLTIHT